MDSEGFSEFRNEAANFSSGAASPDDIFSVLEAWESASDYTYHVNSSAAAGVKDGEETNESFEFQKSAASPTCKKQKLTSNGASAVSASPVEEGQHRMLHITVERKRRKQMNHHLSVLRSLMPCFYVKRGDQASIIGGVVDYINELQQVLQSLEAKKQRKSRLHRSSKPEARLKPQALSAQPAKAAFEPEIEPPHKPEDPLPSSPYKPLMHHHHHLQPPGYLNSPSLPSPVDPSPCNSSASSSINDAMNELVATSKSAVAEVEVKFAGPNLLLKTVSHRIPGQVVKIVSALEELALEILHVSIATVDETMLNSFTIKIGIECQLSAEELVEQIQHTFC